MEELVVLAVDAAHAAGVLLLERFAAPRTGIGTKSTATDMVTDADRAAEELILSRVRAVRPNDALLGEETGEVPGASGLRWVVDPLDGTTNFLYGIPQWAISIAVEDASGVLVGVVYDAVRDELFLARRGAGACLNGVPIAVSTAGDVAGALCATGFSYASAERAAAAAMLPEILPRVRDIRRGGAASLDLAWVACGRLDGYFETPIAWWDVAAGTLLVEEAGGRTGRIPSLGGDGTGYVAAGPGIYGELQTLVAGALGHARGDLSGR